MAVLEDSLPTYGLLGKDVPNAEDALREIQLCAGQLAIPVGLFRSRAEDIPESELRKRQAFQKSSESTWNHLVQFLSNVPDAVSAQVLNLKLCDLLILCGSYLGDSQSTWSSDISQSSAREMLGFLTRHFFEEGKTEVTNDLIRTHALTILNRAVVPYFSSSPKKDAFTESATRLGQRVVTGIEEQAWKSQCLTALPVFGWLCESLNAAHFRAIGLPMFVPVVLTLMEDFEPRMKQRGVELFSHIFVQNALPSDLLLLGLNDAFLKALGNCCHAHDNAELVKAALKAYINYVVLVTVPNSRDAFNRLSLFLEELVFPDLSMSIHNVGLKSGRVTESFVLAVKRVLEILGDPLAMLYLKPSAGCLCEVLELVAKVDESELDPDGSGLFSACCLALESVIRLCQPRIHCSRGIIIKSLASATMDSYEDRQRSLDAATGSAHESLRTAAKASVQMYEARIELLEKLFCLFAASVDYKYIKADLAAIKSIDYRGFLSKWWGVTRDRDVSR